MKAGKILVLSTVVLALSATMLSAQNIDRNTLTNKVMCGYQGWHCCPGDGNAATVGWNHWANDRSSIGPGNYHTEIWPDVTEYSTSDLYSVPNTTLTYGGTPYLYSARKLGAVKTHFRWMQENGIDGAFLQRFIHQCPGNPSDPFQNHRDTVLQNVMSAATTYGRVFAVEYDVSDADEATLYSRLTNDWNYLKNTFNVKNHARYLYHNGMPVVVIWGLGFEDRPGTPAIAQNIIDWFQNDGCFVIGGVPWGWRTRTGGSKTDPAWDAVYRSFDGITPWTVGLYSDWNGISYNKTNYIQPDLNECNSLGILYMPTSWPRFGWDNMNNLPCGQSDISPRGGQHLWDQFYAWKSIGAPCQFLAMFDEYDESSAIMKLTDNIPTSGCWWTTQGYGSDWYLRLANQGSKMQRGDIALSQTIPINSGTSPDNAVVVSDTIPTSMNPGQQYNVSVTMRNTGETAWNEEYFKLGAVGDSDPFYGSSRVLMSGGTRVTYNGTYTFSFTMTAPSTPGAYTSDWQMVHERIRWFGGTLTKQIEVGGGGSPIQISNSPFTSGANGWTFTGWKASPDLYQPGTIARVATGGNPDGCVLCNGYGTGDNTDRCMREGGQMTKTITTAGHSGIRFTYDLKVNTLGGNYTGAGTGTCSVDHNLIDEQLTVYYSTNGGSSWTQCDNVLRSSLLANYQNYGNRSVDLTGVSACNDNASFALKFRWQLNQVSDSAWLDRIVVTADQ